MKAEVIREPYHMANLKTGDVVEIIPGMETDAEGIWNVATGKLVLCKKEDGTFTYASMLDMKIIDNSSVDWDAFRREAAKDILVRIIASSANMNIWTYEQMAYMAIGQADELIKQLIEDEK